MEKPVEKKKCLGFQLLSFLVRSNVMHRLGQSVAKEKGVARKEGVAQVKACIVGRTRRKEVARYMKHMQSKVAW